MMKMNKTMLFVVALVAVAGCRCAPDGDTGPAVPFARERLVSLGSPYKGELKDAELLNEYGDLALFVGETEADAAFNAEPGRKNDLKERNSLFLRRRTNGGRDEWRLLLTSGGDWKDADCMGNWGKRWVDDVRDDCKIVRASFSKDGRFVWMVCDPSCSFWYDVVCRLDLREKTLAVLVDGDSADEEEDGTIWVLNKKIYLTDKNGEPDGAAWIEEWITPDGKVVRKGEPKRLEDTLDYDTAVRLRRAERAKKQKETKKSK